MSNVGECEVGKCPVSHKNRKKVTVRILIGGRGMRERGKENQQKQILFEKNATMKPNTLYDNIKQK